MDTKAMTALMWKGFKFLLKERLAELESADLSEVWYNVGGDQSVELRPKAKPTVLSMVKPAQELVKARALMEKVAEVEGREKHEETENESQR